MADASGDSVQGPPNVSLDSKEFYLLLLLVACVGGIGALLMVVFIFLQDAITHILWAGIPTLSVTPVLNPWILVICMLGGLVVGAIRVLFRGEIAIMAEDLVEFAREGRFSLKRGAELFIRGLVSLVCGAPLGPEAPLTVSAGAAGTFIAEKARLPRPVVLLSSLGGISGFFGAFLASPFAGALIFIETTLEEGTMTWKAVLPSIVAATAGFAVYFLLSGIVPVSMFALPPYEGFRDIHLLYAVALGIIGGGCGILFILVYQKMRGLFEPLEKRPLLLGLAGGLGLGIMGMLLPLALFMGSDQLQFLIDEYLGISLLFLAILIAGKILLMSFSFSTGFAGGYIFPAFFIGGTLGILVFRIFPFIPLAVCIVCTIAAVSVSLLRSPIAIALIIAILFQRELIPVVAIALVTGFIVSSRYSLPYRRKIPGMHGDR